MQIDHKEILAVYRKSQEEQTYQMVCMRLAIEHLEKQNQELQNRIRELEETATKDSA